MIAQDTLLVSLVKLVAGIPLPAPPAKRGRGRPKTYSDRLFLQALVIMIIRHLHNVHELLSVLNQPTAEMQLVSARCSPATVIFPRAAPGSDAWQPFLTACLHRLAAWAAAWSLCSKLGPNAVGQSLWIALYYVRAVVYGIKKTVMLERCRTHRSILRRTGPSRAGMGGCMDGSCIL